MPEFTINELGNALNQLNAKALEDMVRLAEAAGGTLVYQNDLTLSVQTTGEGVNQRSHLFIDGIDIGQINREVKDGVALNPNDGIDNGSTISVDVSAGALVKLQYKIDQMMAAIQEGIKNSGKVSQTREGAARA